MNNTDLKPPGRTPSRPPSAQSRSSSRPPSASATPKSDILRDILREKRGESRRLSSTPGRSSGPTMKTNNDTGAIPSGDDRMTARSTQKRPRAGRSASLSAGVNGSPRNLPSRETDILIDKLEKENFDVKLRLRLVQDKNTKLERELDKAQEKLEEAQDVEGKYTMLKDELGDLVTRIEALEEEIQQETKSNKELQEANDELVKELDKRDKAVQEAATIIHALECNVRDLEETLADTNFVEERPDSDYYSAEHEAEVPSKVLPSTPHLAAARPPGSAHGSDYFSAASTSPNYPLRTPRPLSRRKNSIGRPAPTQSIPSYQTSSEKSLSAAGSKESIQSMPLVINAPLPSERPSNRRSSTHSGALRSPDSLDIRPPRQQLPSKAISYSPIELPANNSVASQLAQHPPQQQSQPVYRHQHRLRPTPKPAPLPVPIPASSARPLKQLYLSGELGRQIHSRSPPVPPALFSPAMSPVSPTADDDDIFLPYSPRTRTSPPAPSTIASESSFGYGQWGHSGGPGQYPEWPGSGYTGGRNVARDLFFSHEDIDDPLPPRST